MDFQRMIPAEQGHRHPLQSTTQTSDRPKHCESCGEQIRLLSCYASGSEGGPTQEPLVHERHDFQIFRMSKLKKENV